MFQGLSLSLFLFSGCFFFFKYRIEFIQDMGMRIKRLVEAEKGKEEERVEAGHEHMERGGRE